MKEVKALERATKIIVDDFRDWVPGRDSNGGNYSYHYIFEAVPNGFKVKYSTSSDFPYCEKYGYFTECERCSYSNWHGDVWSCNAPDEVWSEQKLMSFINDNINEEDFEIFLE